LFSLKTNNSVKYLDMSRNPVSNDLNQFKMMQHFLLGNKILEVLNLSGCGIKEKAAEIIGRGLRGNRNL
jgi:hypothetical protein